MRLKANTPHLLDIVSNLVREDTSDLPFPASPSQYAFLYWVQHLQKIDTLLQDQDGVDDFLRLHLLHWLEALAWLGRTSEGILALISLGQIQVKFVPLLFLICSE